MTLPISTLDNFNLFTVEIICRTVDSYPNIVNTLVVDKSNVLHTPRTGLEPVTLRLTTACTTNCATVATVRLEP